MSFLNGSGIKREEGKVLGEVTTAIKLEGGKALIALPLRHELREAAKKMSFLNGSGIKRREGKVLGEVTTAIKLEGGKALIALPLRHELFFVASLKEHAKKSYFIYSYLVRLR